MTLSVPDITPDHDTIGAALAYASAGWYVLPIRPDDKNAGSRLGKGWHEKTSRDPERVISWFAGSSDLLALHVGRSGAVCFDVDRPDQQPEALRDAAPLAAFHSTRADDPERGHYLFAVPPGRMFGNGGGRLGRAWGEVRGRNGIVVVSPSIHPHGGRYAWVRTGPLAVIPDELAAMLPDGAPGEGAVTDAEVRAFLDRHTEVSRPELLRSRLAWIAEQVKAGGSRHQVTVTTTVLAFKEAAAGYYPAEDAHSQIWTSFEYYATNRHPADPGGKIRTAQQAKVEFDDIAAWAVAQASRPEAVTEAREWVEGRALALAGARGGFSDLLIAPAAPAGAPATAIDLRPAQADPSDHWWEGCFASLVEDQPCECGPAAPSREVALPTPTGALRAVGRLPEDFWNARPVLRHIRQAAHARARSGDVVFGGLLARLAAMLPPELKADTGVGSPASLNMFVPLLGPSGSGKSSAAWIPRSILAPPPGLDFLDELPLGTGEGIAEAYMGEKLVKTGELHHGGASKGLPKTERTRTQVRHNALFYADEGEALTKQLFGRNGATVGESLRRAWTGGTIGQFNGQKVNTRVIEAGTYSLGLVIGFQPETALPLLADAAAGTPQRFLWVASTDPTIPEDVITPPGPLDLTLIKHGFGTTPKISFPAEILREIRQDDRARATGAVQLPPLDSHMPLMRVKLAALLAILDDRLDVNAEDWQLALVVWETSRSLRDALVEYGARQQAEETEQRTRAHVDREVRTHSARAAVERSVERVARRVAKQVHEAGGMTRGAANRATAHRDRDRLADAVDFAESRGWIAVEGDELSPGDSAPT